MTVETIGHGAGTKDFLDRPNILRLLVGTTADTAGDTVVVLETNLDDVSGEVVGYATERLFAAGALDAYTIPMQMKKGRPGVLLGVIAPPAKAAELEAVLFRETGTLGVRRHTCQRSVRPRSAERMETPWGPVAVKRAGNPEQVTPEYEDAARLARENGVPLREVYRAVAGS
jgi:pyridinium-3,5-bisthiocarboxylic acid mononucleotide nickel chelatase